MAIANISQITIKETDCDLKPVVADQIQCLNLLAAQYQEIIDSNDTTALAYSLKSQQIALTVCPPSILGQVGYKCIKDTTASINTIKQQIATSDAIVTDMQPKLTDLKNKIASLKANPAYVKSVTSNTLTKTIGISVIVIILVVIGIWAYRKYKK